MLRTRITALVFAATFSTLAQATDSQPWPWVLFGPDIEHCAQFDAPTRQRLLRSLSRASESTKNLLPTSIWLAYEQHIASKTGNKSASPADRTACDAFVAKLEAPNLSARLRGEFFLGLLQRAPFDCMLDDPIKGKNLLGEFKKFYERNGLVYPEQAIQTQVAKMRADGVKVRNGWDTPHCMDLQRSLGTGALDKTVSESAMRQEWFSSK